ncbi:phosphoribosyl-AMP cyclohydrolase [Acuticoccus sp. MNP-M23]|uniref:phosphoribosyl-AMP cyclohydrolase n=1 Tax=Acuticoccus sp. MNP-M23 TaxID=3072793 RepID=UPI0028169DB2|nr:phosphoribosyl-AMP cyclohydrolase [Acuticoccus sp. MNP-M23]WMS42504.1 phosphoribosyl-AMP cyclohydrolase [Acuticoccus sp. MNP-M23]
MSHFSPPADDKTLQEHGTAFRPKFDAAGLVTAIAQDDGDGAILMVAHMNEAALDETLRTGIAHYWSRSRAKLWKKGETSGQLQTVQRILVDCDQDALVLRVTVGGDGGACHTGARSCFYRTVTAERALKPDS